MKANFIDVISYFKDNNIKYWTEGKNVSKGWVNIKCPFCMGGDPSNHLGINLQSKKINCWRCSKKGDFFTLIMKLNKCGFGKAQQIAKKFYTTKVIVYDRTAFNPEFKLPKVFSRELTERPKKYLEERNFVAQDIWDTYYLHYPIPDHWGDYRYRLCIPFTREGEISTFTARDITGRQDPKYIVHPNEKSLYPVNQCVYNLDRIEKGVNLVILEGPTDVWRYKYNAVCVYGITYTPTQIRLIKEREPKKIFIIFDPGAEKEADKLANELGIYFPVEVIFLDGEKDIGDYKENDSIIRELREITR